MEFEKISIGLKTHNGTELELGAIAVETTDDPALFKVLRFVDSAMSGVGAKLPRQHLALSGQLLPFHRRCGDFWESTQANAVKYHQHSGEDHDEAPKHTRPEPDRAIIKVGIEACINRFDNPSEPKIYPNHFSAVQDGRCYTTDPPLGESDHSVKDQSKGACCQKNDKQNDERSSDINESVSQNRPPGSLCTSRVKAILSLSQCLLLARGRPSANADGQNSTAQSAQ
ncbi:hypothetical protein [Agrobacterium rosae]|uniref:hypothetical protein n=1 Tax=Agrobacterium rosae TaxID=1972867 RepID=UPI0015F2CD1D|nr:hypothetical protein [Agrobacterium rosae]